MEPPDTAILPQLRELTRVGLTGQLERRAAALEADPRHAGFAQELRRLASTFDRQALLDYLVDRER